MFLRKSFVVAGALMALAATAGASEAATCDRACLRTVLDQYLNAVVKKDPAAAPLAPALRQTENALAITTNNGVWKSVTALGKLQRKYYDPVQQSAGFYGTLVEGDSGSIATLRIKVEDRMVTEAEWIIGRANTGGPQANGPGSTSIEGAEMANAQPPVGRLPGRKATRSELIRLVDGYFDMTQTNNQELFKSVPNFIRLENGIGTGAAPSGMRRGGGPGPVGPYPGNPGVGSGVPGVQGGGGRGAAAGPADGVCGGICAVVARRYPVVDEEAGVVLAIVVFQRPAGNANRRNLLSEWFTIGDGTVHGIYAAMHYLGQTMIAPNWPPYEGNFPMATYLPGADQRAPALAPVAAPPSATPPTQ